ncbi:PAS domain-containing hybrid sensor histidine kinase/response regulator [Paractinoplanes durhamensis]|uniref:PAS domain-containing hybrid sensor histidine kinase/response regulator n=1 Tax=Paractinoplanes durhamensis TaxID=113563 RepID=UPI0031D6CE76
MSSAPEAAERAACRLAMIFSQSMGVLTGVIGAALPVFAGPDQAAIGLSLVLFGAGTMCHVRLGGPRRRFAAVLPVLAAVLLAGALLADGLPPDGLLNGGQSAGDQGTGGLLPSLLLLAAAQIVLFTAGRRRAAVLGAAAAISAGALAVPAAGHSPAAFIAVRAGAAALLPTGGRAARQAQLETIMRHTPTAFFVKGLDGRYRMASAAFEQLYGVEPGTAAGRLDSEIHTGRKLAEVARRDRLVVDSAEPLVFEDEVPGEHGLRSFVTTVFAMRSDGGEAYAICGVTSEITQLRIAESKFKALLDASPEAMICVDAEGVVVLANARAAQVFHYRPDELLGMPVETLIPAAQRDRHRAHRRAYLAAPAPRKMGEGMRLTALCGDGTECPVEISLAAVDGEGGTVVFATVQDVTDRIAQAQSDAQLAGIVAASSDAIVSKTLDGTILTWNPGAARLYGYTAEEMIGRDVTVILPDDKPDEERRLLARVRSGELVKHHETRRVRQDGTTIYVSLSMAPIRDPGGVIVGASTISHDITAEVEAEQRLRFEREQFQMIMTAASDPFVSMDYRGLITEWNRQSEQVFGWTREQVLGRHVVDTILPRRYGAALDRILEGRWDWLLDRPTEMDAVRADGTVLPIELTMWRVRRDDRSTFHAFARDITARRQTEQALAQARDQAVETARLKSQFLASMSHEIRTPMNGVIGLSGLLLETDLAENQHRYAQGINNAGVALLAVINDVLDFSKLEAGKVVPERANFEIGRLLDEVVALVGDVTGAKSLIVIAGCHPDLAGPVSGDPGKLRQVLLNLAGNAVKFTAGGRVTVTAAPAEGDVPDGRMPVRFEVADTGIGIDADQQAALFEPFIQADASTTRRFGGTGLGLAISRELVGVMGGEIGLVSEAGKGSTFWFTVPLWPPVDGVEPQPRHVAEVPAGRGHVLLVEDNDINQTVALGILGNLGWSADVAGDGREAVRMAAAQDYQAIFMDCLMPEMDGYEATAAIRRAETGDRHVPIIAMTAGALPEDRQRCLAAGMDDHIAKPLMPAGVATALETWARPGVRRQIEERLDLLRGAGAALGPAELAGLLRRLSASTPGHVEQIAQAVATDDADRLHEQAHQLKGVAANLGARDLAAVCDRLERVARAGDLDAAVEPLSELRPRTREMLAAIDSILAETAADQAAVTGTRTTASNR